MAGHGNVASFIVVGVGSCSGTRPVRRSRHVGPGIRRPVLLPDGAGPLNFNHTAHGIRMDTLSRFERISYPAFAWLVAAGGVARALVARRGERHRTGLPGRARRHHRPGCATTRVVGPAASELLRLRVGAVSRSGRDRHCHLRGRRCRGAACAIVSSWPAVRLQRGRARAARPPWSSSPCWRWSVL